MSHLRLCCGFALVLLGCLLLAPAPRLWAQQDGAAAPKLPPPVPKAKPEEAPPKSIREAYERAEKFGEDLEKQKPAAAQEAARSPWVDGVHYVGVSGGALLLASLGTGLWIYLVVAFRRGKDRVLVRRQWRKWHYVLGFGAGALALAHAVARYLQLGAVGPPVSVPVVTGAAFILLVVSGIIRAWPPRPLARHFTWWTWSHHALTAAAVIMLFWHGITMYALFVLHR